MRNNTPHKVEDRLGTAWLLRGKKHREDGPARIGPKGILQVWYKHGVVHREKGPAVIEANRKAWFKDGVYHRKDGPAIEKNDGTTEYWVDGIKIEEDSFIMEVIQKREKIRKDQKEKECQL